MRGTFQGMSEDSRRPFIDIGPFMALTARHPVVVGQRILKKPIVEVHEDFSSTQKSELRILNLVHQMIFYHKWKIGGF